MERPWNFEEISHHTQPGSTILPIPAVSAIGGEYFSLQRRGLLYNLLGIIIIYHYNMVNIWLIYG